MTEAAPARLRAAITLVVATISFALALALRARFDPWQSTALAAVISIALALWTLGPRRHALFAVTWRGALGAAVLGIVLVVATHAAFWIAERASPDLARSVRTLYTSVDVGASRFTLGLLTAVVVLGEELVWRGVAIELATGRSKAAAGMISVALYVLPQLVAGVPLLIVAATALGALFAAQRLVTGRLIEPLITHAVWSIAVFVVVPLAAAA